jgi:hypothetical protein
MNACPRCGAPAETGQEYCLDCGGRLPDFGRLGAPGDPGRGWLLRAGLGLVAAVAGAAVAVAATDSRTDGSSIVVATGGFATAPDTLPDQGTPGASGIVEWPTGDQGWTIAIASVPQTEGRRVALARARAARRKGLTSVGVLDSSRYASLHPGYWVVFAGIYGSEAEATSALVAARRASRTATVRRVVP